MQWFRVERDHLPDRKPREHVQIIIKKNLYLDTPQAQNTCTLTTIRHYCCSIRAKSV